MLKEFRLFGLLTSLVLASSAYGDQQPESTAPEPVSYYHDIRPLFQARCQGCHQPAKASGQYVMTSFEQILASGESELPAIVPHAPDESYLLELVTPVGGAAEMPKEGEPLDERQVNLIRQWIVEGAVDDTPAGTERVYDADHPPVYVRPPVITSLDFSPDGRYLAVTGFHEVLLYRSDGSELVSRLIGLSERLESVRFSPDGKRLAVTGGRPGRTGEVQIWDVETYELLLSRPITHDTVYGASWSPDGKHIAIGCADNSVRAIDSVTGEQIVYMAAHDDWVRGTTFAHNGKAIFSVSRDQTVKMTDVATARFVGNVTTHTPGVLRGGMNAIDRHPTRDELVAGGADGAPKLFKMTVTAAPNSGGNPNQIREFAGMPGRVFAVCFSPDGKFAFAGSSLDGSGQIRAYETDSDKVVWSLDVSEGGIFALAASPDAKTLAAAGFDGTVRLLEALSGSVKEEFIPVELSEQEGLSGGDTRVIADEEPERLPEQTPTELLGLRADPESIEISRPTDYAQILVTGQLHEGVDIDVTRMATWKVEGEVGAVSESGLFTPVQDGEGKIIVEVIGKTVEIPVVVSGSQENHIPDFVRDVTPVISKIGCNAGTCHGSKDGKNGFKLSLRGYDPLLDVRSLTDDLASRRVSGASPETSLMLLKSTASVPHVGAQVVRRNSKYYWILREWIANGAKLDRTSPRVIGLEIHPINPVLQGDGSLQQMRAVATYADGVSRDITREAFVESGNTDIAEPVADRAGMIRALRRGEAPVLVRYEGAYASTMITVMGDRSGFVWEQPPVNNRIDELVHAKLERTKTLPSPLCDDYQFIRRVWLDLTGLPPTADRIREFVSDPNDSRWKRDALVDQLVGSPDYVEHWSNKWADLLQVNSKFLGSEGASSFRAWIRGEVEQNTPYDQFVRKILTVNGSNRENPAASYYKILRSPQETMENTTHLFLGTRFNCNKCHDHPFERWTQDQYYQLAAYFAKVGLKKDPESGDKSIKGTSVEGDKPLYEIVFEQKEGEVQHLRTGEVAPPTFPYESEHTTGDGATRRQQLAAWITSTDNQYFATSYVNRVWGYLTGAGMIEPLDDIRAGNPPTNPELLEWLTREFISSGFDTHQLIRTICKSRTYQLSLETNRWNEDDQVNYSHARPRRLPAEVLYDAIYQVTGATSKFPGVPAGIRAAALPDVGVKLPDGFLGNLGRPARESACECERTSEMQLGPVMALISGPTVNDAISDPDNEIARLVASQPDDHQLLHELFLRIVNRPATEAEIREAIKLMDQLTVDHQQVTAKLNAYEAEYSVLLETRKRERQAEAEKQEEMLAAYKQELAPRLAKQELERQQVVLQRERELRSYDDGIFDRLIDWQKQQRTKPEWIVLDPQKLNSSNGAALTKQDDLSAFSSGRRARTISFVAETDASGITAFRLEALTDERLPKNGPGRSGDGQFVLTEFEVHWAPIDDQASEDDDPEWRKVNLVSAAADFSQEGYHVWTAIDGKTPNSDNGWGIQGKAGKDRVAVFETQDDVGANGRVLLRFTLNQNDTGEFTELGRFRVSVTDVARPVPVRPFEEIADILAMTPEEWSEEETEELKKHFRQNDGMSVQLKTKLDQAKRPYPVDDKLKSLLNKIVELRGPLPDDEKLQRLQRYAKNSEQQLQNKRLTVAQDLAWALINSPGFLFNH